MPSTSSRRRGVLFDVDGTLVDSNYLHTLAWARAFHDVGRDVPMYAIHRAIGMGSDQLVEHLLGGPNEAASNGHSRHMQDLRDDQRPFAGAADLLREVKRRGAMVALATSAKPEEIEHLQDLIGARDAVDVVTGSQDVERSKPAPDLFQVTLERCGLDARDAFAVGDSRWDIEAAAQIGLRCIAVLTGGNGAAEL